jgi:hypothetical protein
MVAYKHIELKLGFFTLGGKMRPLLTGCAYFAAGIIVTILAIAIVAVAAGPGRISEILSYVGIIVSGIFAIRGYQRAKEKYPN